MCRNDMKHFVLRRKTISASALKADKVTKCQTVNAKTPSIHGTSLSPLTGTTYPRNRAHSPAEVSSLRNAALKVRC